MCNSSWQGIDVMAMNKDMTLTEKILYDLKESNKRYKNRGADDGSY